MTHKELLTNLAMLVEYRIEQVFQKIQENPSLSYGDAKMLQLCDKLADLLEEIEKI